MTKTIELPDGVDVTEFVQQALAQQQNETPAKGRKKKDVEKVATATTEAKPTSCTRTFEYMKEFIADHHGANHKPIGEVMNGRGGEGWELVWLVADTSLHKPNSTTPAVRVSGYTVIWKREV